MDSKLTFLFEIAHPKHFYQFRFLIELLEKEGHKTRVIARDKDILLKLLREFHVEFDVYGRHGKSMWKKMMLIPSILADYQRCISRYRPDYIISKSSPYAAILSKVNKAKSIIFPDAEIVPLTNKFVVPLTYAVVTPANYSLDYGKKHHRIQGIFEEAYLNRKYFTPDSGIYSLLGVNPGEAYILIRFIGWFANHDVNQKGISNEEKVEIVKELSAYAKVFVSAEGQIPDEIKEYQLKIPVSKVHSALYFASLYFGDSQTMAAEAALLGTPSIRTNSFVGDNDMSNFKLLEQEYKLLFNFNNYSQALTKAVDLMKDPATKTNWQERAKQLYERKTDLNMEMYQVLKAICKA